MSQRVSAQEQIKPRILLIFDTSASMQYFVDSGGYTYGDGSWDAWGDRFCCPGTGNSRMYHAKEAVRQMVFATGDIDFALMKYPQHYTSATDPEDYYSISYYEDNQNSSGNDVLRYNDNGCIDFDAYDPDDSTSAYEWLCVEFPEDGEDTRGAVMMWMDHHEFNSDGSPDIAPVFDWSRAGDGLEQELRATTYTPLAGSMYAAETYLEYVFSEDYAANPATALCRPYSVVLLTDGQEYCDGDTNAASQALHQLEDADEIKDVSIWAIGFGLDNFTDELDEIASNGGTGYARTATSQEQLSGVLYDIVSASLLVEVCNQEDDDCDGLTDEDFRFDRTYCNRGDACEFPNGGQAEEEEDILCERPPECACDGIDNNCDGEVDEPPDGENSWPVLEDACGGCDETVPGQEYCSILGPNEGRCEQGDLVCVPGDGYSCVGSVGPIEETCNGLDDDCDGETDEGEGESCGPCGDGHWYCVDGVLQCCGDGTTSDNCVDITEPEVEVCNGDDDDCDGLTDEDLYQSCGGCDASIPEYEYCDDPNEGVCEEGVSICEMGEWQACEGGQGPEEEICNDQDDDCDGLTDEDLVGESCGTCGDGNWYCVEGAEQCCSGLDIIDGECIPVQVPTFEICNNLDDDCDGDTDEGVPPRECMDEEYESLAGIGICNKGYQTCVEGQWGNENPATGEWELDYCRGQQLPVTETCNLVDDDCDGDTDEDIVGESGCGPCGDGEEQCINGILQCTGARTPGVEECNNEDDDCDGYTDENLSRPCMDDAYAELDGIGICHGGIEMCKAGEWGYGETLETWEEGVCGNQQLPQEEQCDCLDNDCDGDTDEELGAPVGETCNACGVWECQECELVCTGFGEPEVCDGEDNNCNGLTDEGIQESCGGCVEDETTEDLDDALLEDCLEAQSLDSNIGPGEGECQVGVRICDPSAEDDWSSCQGYISPQVERCDAKDNDCDGETDEAEDIEMVGELCSTAVGECEEGWWRCVETIEGTKSLECCAEVTDEGVCIPPSGPGVEECNGLDDDCDGATDEDLPNAGQSCGLDMGICEPGTVECVCEGDEPDTCSMQCVGETGGADEVCNALDDDCDGLTDEGIPLGGECTNAPGGVPTGECDSGFEQCINGEWVCNANEPSDEICDGLDNDCDGATDENLTVECPENSWCIEGECAPACMGDELACLPGTKCVETESSEGSGIRVCLTDVCSKGSEEALPCVENPYWCDEGYEPLCKCSQAQKKCISICEDVVCPDGKTCVARTGQCQAIEEDCYASGCPEGEICQGGVCVEDPCPASCGEGEYCNGSGECVSPCVDITCTEGICFEGACVDRCEDVSCETGEVCNEVTGECEEEGACDGVNCKYYEVCQGGECVEDPCLNIDCPNGYICEHGSCSKYGEEEPGPVEDPEDTDEESTDGEEHDHEGTDPEKRSDNYGMDRVLATGTGGCLCNSAPGARSPNSAGLIFGALGMLLLFFRFVLRGVKVRAMLLSVLFLAMVLSGCALEPYELSSGGGGLRSTDRGTEVAEDSESGESPDPEGNDTESGGCDPGADDDDCDGVDDDCDGEIDEDVDLEKNANHCGKCGNDCTTKYANAFGVCDSGTCKMGECAPFYQDLNEDADDGCEYFCQKRSDSDGCNGVDLGDGSYVGVDDDCDGETDEDVDLSGNRFNCGRCGNVCSAPHTKPICESGVCSFESCEDSFYDVDGEADNGCEYRCETTEVEELCNGVDDDCDGDIDEGNPGGGASCYTLTNGCEEEGGEIVCHGRCEAGVEQCENGQLVCNGQVSPAPTESCNNIDDNCDGQTDELLSRTCRSADADYEETGACLQGSQSCEAGEWGECLGEIQPSEELCDGIDNDCDGETDEDPVNVGETCGGSPNSSDPNEGACQQGMTICEETNTVCDGEIAPSQEQCDGIDNDCDGFTDENITTVCGGCDPAEYDYCEARDQGLCQPGVKYCEGGTYGACVASIGPQEEVCDGFDNDCDGTTDVDENGEPITGVSCGTCGGIEYCLGGQMSCCLHLDGDGLCVEPGAATGETCNGIDDDCDGITDNNLVQSLCDGDDADSCAEGVATCEDGVPGCSDTTDDNEEVCDGVDNDCNGATDDGLSGAPDGWCNDACDALGALVSTTCAGATGWVCNYNCATSEDHDLDEVQCNTQNQVVTAETWCNGLDDDCDGLTDENLKASVEHCGACGNDCWELVGGGEHVASVACVAGNCRINECDEGYWDLDGNEDGILDCEYGSCTRTGSEGTVCDGEDNDCDGETDNGAATVEVCDGEDNDCDGDTDEELTPPDICNSQCPNPTSHVAECLGELGWKCNYNCIGEPDGTVSCDGDEYTLSEEESLCDGIDNNCDGSTDEGFILWDTTAVPGARCSSEGEGACAAQGWVTCNASGDGYDCCGVEGESPCSGGNIIVQNPTPALSDEAGTEPNGIDDDCDGVVDDGADGCITTVHISGLVPDSEFDIFAYEASRREGAAAPCSESSGLPDPWTNISFTDARQACLRLNTAESGCDYDEPDGNADTCWDLCSAEQWYYSCAYWGDLADAPHRYPYGDTYSGSTCNGNDYGEGDVLGTGEATDCLAEWGTTDVMDLSGNVEEWTLDTRTVSDTNLRVIRGGSYKTVENGMTCDFDFFAADETELQMDQLGFRCCRGTNPITTCQNGLTKIPNHPFDFNITGITAQCSTDGWWRADDDDPADARDANEWELGKSDRAEVGATDNCVWGTDLDGNYENGDWWEDRISSLYSPHFDLSACSGQSINLSWNMWFNNGDDPDDTISLQVRSSSNGGDSWSSWSNVVTISSNNTNWTTLFEETIVGSVDASRLYQLRFKFLADNSNRDLGAYIDNLTFEIE